VRNRCETDEGRGDGNVQDKEPAGCFIGNCLGCGNVSIGPSLTAAVSGAGYVRKDREGPIGKICHHL
jgi:hypothetical protein